jgi:hypothetical protein
MNGVTDNTMKNYIKKVLKKTPLALKERGVKLG